MSFIGIPDQSSPSSLQRDSTGTKAQVGPSSSPGPDFAAFEAVLKGASGLEGIRPHSLRLAYDALYAKEEEKEREKEKRHQKAVDRCVAQQGLSSYDR